MIGVDADNKSSQDVDNGSQIPWFCTSVGLGFQYRNLGSLQSFSASEATCLSRKHFWLSKSASNPAEIITKTFTLMSNSCFHFLYPKTK